jgi:hypothetical protein
MGAHLSTILSLCFHMWLLLWQPQDEREKGAD